MRAADLLRQYRKSLNPPYGVNDWVVLALTLFLLLVLPLTVVTTQQARDIGSKAKQEKETKVSTLIAGKDYQEGELFIQWKPGVETKAKETLYKVAGLAKIKQAKGTEKYHAQLVKVDPTRAKQTILNLSKNKRIEKVDFILIPDFPEQTDLKAQGLVSPVQAAAIQDSMTTPEGTKIESYTTQVTTQEIYNVLKANAVSLPNEIGPRLTVKVGDDFGNRAFHSFGGGTFVGSFTMGTSSFVPYPDNITSHEYGHIFGHYYRFTVWNGSWLEYQKARGIAGDPWLVRVYLTCRFCRSSLYSFYLLLV